MGNILPDALHDAMKVLVQNSIREESLTRFKFNVGNIAEVNLATRELFHKNGRSYLQYCPIITVRTKLYASYMT